MPTNESGHAKNVALFGDLITGVQSMGDKYHPTIPLLEISSLQAKHTSAKSVMNTVQIAEPPYRIAVTQRQGAYDKMSPLAARIIGMLVASDVDPGQIAEARSIVKKITGNQGKKKNPEQPEAPGGTTGGEEPPKSISTSQQSYDMRKSNFERLIALLKNLPAYAPFEEDLKIPALEAYDASLETYNKSCDETETAYEITRNQRDELLYTGPENLADIVKKVKNYVKGALGATSPEYKRINGIAFRRLI